MLFPHHRASPAAIQATALRAGGIAHDSSALMDAVNGQARSAGGAVTGTLAAPLLSAPAPVIQSGAQVSDAATLVGGCLRRWAASVTLYNIGIDDLNARYQFLSSEPALDTGNITSSWAPAQDPPEEAMATMRSALHLEKARLDHMLDAEAERLSTLLEEGPTQDALDGLAEGGDTPSFWDEFWERLRAGMRGQIVPPENASPFDLARWIALRGTIGIWSLTDWYTVARGGWMFGRSPVGWTKWANPWWTWTPDMFPVQDAQYWSKIASVAKGATLALTGVSGFTQQWQEDSDRPDLQTSDKWTRALSVGTFDAAVVGIGGSAGFQGGLAGARFGAIIGIGGGPAGMAVGALVGATVGAVAGYVLADMATESLMPDEPAPPLHPIRTPPGVFEQRLPPVEPPLLIEPAPPIQVPGLTDPLLPPKVDVELGDSYWRISERLLPWDSTEREILDLKDELIAANPHTGPNQDLLLPHTILDVPQR
ncbi:hypothetical protein [Solicola gregarius]|uniref:Uncharacterized protein n=1 Tax=Solicola gregarius TaxID=2908642 RepID=A0AA46TJK5_9ACTN|nr:hypothetical protein [Solicola gregarius]UYM06290.1 hypothetical protein L0C25_04215 [Solicola gregarius]